MALPLLALAPLAIKAGVAIANGAERKKNHEIIEQQQEQIEQLLALVQSRISGSLGSNSGFSANPFSGFSANPFSGFSANPFSGSSTNPFGDSSGFGMSMQDAMAVFTDQTNNIWKNRDATCPEGLVSREYLESVANGTAEGKFTDQEVAAVKTVLASPTTYEKLETSAYGGTKADGNIAFEDIKDFRANNGI